MGCDCRALRGSRFRGNVEPALDAAGGPPRWWLHGALGRNSYILYTRASEGHAGCGGSVVESPRSLDIGRCQLSEMWKGLAWGVLGLVVFAFATLVVVGFVNSFLEERERETQKYIEARDSPAMQTTVAEYFPPVPTLPTMLAEHWASTPIPSPIPGPTSRAFWERPGAEKTAIASCPEGSRFSSIVIHSPRMSGEEFITKFPHGLVTCTGPPPSSGFGSNMPGFTLLAVTPEPRGVYFSDLVPTVTPTPPSKPPCGGMPCYYQYKRLSSERATATAIQNAR